MAHKLLIMALRYFLMLVVQTTVARKKDAQKIALAMIREGIASCATFFPATSIYRWKGSLCKQREFVVELKMPARNYGKAEKLLLRLHPYSLPQVFAVKPARVLPSYLAWVEE
ncbi:MAG: divalent-cation tolerance protein CutA [Candidatus Micrarchaeota archaeon]|nr:divalent-cation tolerance protein CutA [Candidatus Micrarchaeota archaeon]